MKEIRKKCLFVDIAAKRKIMEKNEMQMAWIKEE